MENNEEIKIENEFELHEQRKEDILKGRYAMVEIIIPDCTTDSKHIMPYCKFTGNKTNLFMISCLYMALEDMLKEIGEEYPAAAMLSKIGLGVKNAGVVKKESKNETE